MKAANNVSYFHRETCEAPDFFGLPRSKMEIEVVGGYPFRKKNTFVELVHFRHIGAGNKNL